MTLRIHFTGEDLARTTVAAEPDPLWEVLLSLHMLQVGDGPTRFGFWRRSTRAELDRDAARRLVPLAPPRGFYMPDFLTPADRMRPDFGDGLDALLGTPADRIRTEVVTLANHTADRSGWIRELAGARADAVERLGGAVRTYHETALTPYWSRIRAEVRADHRRAADRMTSGGIDALMTGLHSRVLWRDSTLHVLDFPDEDLRLDGRGLRLQPSSFCWQVPTKLYDADLPPVLVYPVRPDPDPLRPGGTAVRPSLVALLGRTRATALELVMTGCTTSELAQRCRISLAAASHQTAVLRDAGLIASRREGKHVVHEITQLGTALLAGGDPAGGNTGPRGEGAVPDSRPGLRPGR